MIYVGLFYVIDGFLDMILPADNTSSDKEKAGKQSNGEAPKATQQQRPVPTSWSRSESTFTTGSHGTHATGASKGKSTKNSSQKPLFTVKPGGIAGYLCESSLAPNEVKPD